jgi:hypothetical protein
MTSRKLRENSLPSSRPALLDQRTLVLSLKTRGSGLPQSLFESAFQETEALSCLSLRPCRPLHRARASFQIALRSTACRLKIQDA